MLLAIDAEIRTLLRASTKKRECSNTGEYRPAAAEPKMSTAWRSYRLSAIRG